MKLWQKVLLGAILLPTLGFCIFSWWISYVFDDMCGNNPISVTPSPDKQMKAVIYERDCGATTGFSTRVSVLHSDQALLRSESGNLFIADTDHGKAPNGPKGGPEVRVQWRGDKALSVAYHKAARVFLERPKIQDITVTYTQFD
jgi:hypothetical protein